MAGCELDNSGSHRSCYVSQLLQPLTKWILTAGIIEEDEPVQKVAECPINKMNEEEEDGPFETQHSESAKLHSAIHQKRHWMSIYKMAAHKNIIIDGDYAYFVQRMA